MESFVIDGPSTLQGRVAVSGAKNAALPALAACLLTDGPVHLSRLPAVRDVVTMGGVLEHLGAAVETRNGEPGNDHSATIRSTELSAEREAPYELVKTMRASVLVLGPLVARLGTARVSLPGGCAIGARPIDQHLAGLEAMGASVELEHGYVSVHCKKLVGCRFRFAMPTVTGTENLMMAASLANGTTVLDNCALEPEIQDLADLLTGMGARIEGAGSGTITIEGVDDLHGTDHAVLGDRIEAGTYLIGGPMTGGSVTVDGVQAEHLGPLLEKLSDCGAEVDVSGVDSITVRAGSNLKARDLITAPHPGFPTDLQAQFLALMTRAEGTATIVENVFENRFQHVPELRRMGASISIDGRAARVRGPMELTGARVMATDLRASACLVLAGVAARGETTVDRIYHLDRGYEKMESKLHALGARVRRV